MKVSWGFNDVPVGSRVFSLSPGCSFHLLSIPSDEVDNARDDSWRGLLGSCTTGSMGRRLRPNNIDTTGSSSSKMAGEPYTLYQGRPNHSWLERGCYLCKRDYTADRAAPHEAQGPPRCRTTVMVAEVVD
jgi:hypothetical protein